MPGLPNTDEAPYEAQPSRSGDDNLDVGTPRISAVDLDLRLPSSLLPQQHSFCVPGLVEKEKRLRLAQAYDSLDTLRRDIRVNWKYRTHKTKHTSGTGTKPNTRMASLIKRSDEKIKRIAHRYRAAREALSALDPDGTWSTELHELRPSHLRLPRKYDGE